MDPRRVLSCRRAGFDPVALPDWVVKRFDGKGMAIIGYELDQEISPLTTLSHLKTIVSSRWCLFLLPVASP